MTRTRGERGEVTAVVIVVPVVVFAMLLVVQYALAYHARQVLAGATQDGAAAAARTDATPDDGVALAQTLIGTTAGTLLHDTAVTTQTRAGTITVTASGKVVSMFPFVTVNVRASSSAKLERFDPQGGPP